MTVRGAGVLFLAPDNKVLFLKRSQTSDFPGFWCLPGGAIEHGESAEECAARECEEEIGRRPKGQLLFLARSILQPLPPPTIDDAPPPVAPDPVDFTTFVDVVSEKDAGFVPKLNAEHVGFAWAPADQPPEPLHPGVKIALDRMTMDELGIARAIAAGELTSPQRYKNIWLFAIRITGTGQSFRPKFNEFVWRDPTLYLNDEFLARCNGLSVIWEHPPGATLTTKEYRKRVIGAIMLPYLKGDEVWGIAKIHDLDAGNRLADPDEVWSTSPSVLLGNKADPDQRFHDDKGRTWLVEGKAVLLDHIAICGQGVWDKGGDPEGVPNETRGDSVMTEEEKKAAEDRARKDAERDAKLDKVADTISKVADAVGGVVGRMDALHARMDAVEQKDKARDDAEKARDDAAKARDDAKHFSKRRDDDDDDKYKSRHDSEEGELAAKFEKEGEPKEKAADRAKRARKDAEECESKERDDAAKKARDDAAKAAADAAAKAARDDSIAGLATRIDAIDNRTKPRTPEERAAFAQVQARADAVYLANGSQARAPMPGEDLANYRRSLAAGLKQYSEEWKDTKLFDVSDFPIADEATFTAVETKVYEAAKAHARRPGGHPDGRLREVRSTENGHTVVEFFGDTRAWMDPFAGVGQRAVGDWKGKNLGRGGN